MSKKGLGKIALGATVGAGLALLFAPKKGADLRGDIKKKIDAIIKDVDQMKVEDIKKEFKDKVEEVTNELEDLNKENLESKELVRYSLIKEEQINYQN